MNRRPNMRLRERYMFPAASRQFRSTQKDYVNVKDAVKELLVDVSKFESFINKPQFRQIWRDEQIFLASEGHATIGELIEELRCFEHINGVGISELLRNIMTSENCRRPTLQFVYSFLITTMHFQTCYDYSNNLMMEFMTIISTFARTQSESESWRFSLILAILACSPLEFLEEEKEKLKRVLESVKDLMKHEMSKAEKYGWKIKTGKFTKSHESCFFMTKPATDACVIRIYTAIVRLLEAILKGSSQKCLERAQKIASLLILVTLSYNFDPDDWDDADEEDEEEEEEIPWRDQHALQEYFERLMMEQVRALQARRQ